MNTLTNWQVRTVPLVCPSTVSIAPLDGRTFKGFIIEARPAGNRDVAVQFGVFTPIAGTKLVCGVRMDNYWCFRLFALLFIHFTFIAVLSPWNCGERQADRQRQTERDRQTQTDRHRQRHRETERGIKPERLSAVQDVVEACLDNLSGFGNVVVVWYICFALFYLRESSLISVLLSCWFIQQNTASATLTLLQHYHINRGLSCFSITISATTKTLNFTTSTQAKAVLT